LHTGALCWYYK